MQIIEIDGLLYGAENPKIKTEHGKTGEVVIGGFQRFMHTATDFDACYNSGVYDGQACDLCPHGAECSGKEDEE
jgi:hypothetical protein